MRLCITGTAELAEKFATEFLRLLPRKYKQGLAAPHVYTNKVEDGWPKAPVLNILDSVDLAMVKKAIDEYTQKI
jgi:hypothetical protein